MIKQEASLFVLLQDNFHCSKYPVIFFHYIPFSSFTRLTHPSLYQFKLWDEARKTQLLQREKRSGRESLSETKKLNASLVQTFLYFRVLAACLFLILKIRLGCGCVCVFVCMCIIYQHSVVLFLHAYLQVCLLCLFSLRVEKMSFILVSLVQEQYSLTQYFSHGRCTLNVYYTKGLCQVNTQILQASLFGLPVFLKGMFSSSTKCIQIKSFSSTFTLL